MNVNRVIRGGSWNNHAQNVRAAYRNANDPGNRNNNLGFRCVEFRATSDELRLNRRSSGPISIGENEVACGA